MNKLALYLAALKAWDEAKAAKKAETELTTLKTAHDAALKAYNEEVVAKSKAAEAGVDEESAAIKALVAEALNEHLPELKKLLTEEQGKLLTEDKLKSVVEAALAGERASAEAAKRKVDSKAVAMAAMKNVINDVKGTKSFLGGAGAGDASDAALGGDSDRLDLDLQVGLSKATLPIHMKQLLNVIQTRNDSMQNQGIDSSLVSKALEEGNRMLMRTKMHGLKAITTSGTGTGAEWMPRDLSAELQRRLYLDSGVAAAFMASEWAMPTDPWDLPLLKQDGDFDLQINEGQDAAASDPSTGKITLTTKTFKALRQISDQAEEDSIIAMLPTLQADLARSGARSLEDAIINGDTTATHQDTGSTVPAASRLRAWKGMRYYALAVAGLKNDISSGGISRANLTGTMKKLGKWAGRTNDLLWVWGPKANTDLLGLDEFVLAYANQKGSTFADGAPLRCPYGGQYVVSEKCREDLNASGVWDNSTVTKGSLLIAHKPSWLMGYRRQWNLEAQKSIRAGVIDVVASFRRAFIPMEVPAATTAQTVVIAYNYSS